MSESLSDQSDSMTKAELEEGLATGQIRPPVQRMKSTFLDAHQGEVYVYPGTGPKGHPAITLDVRVTPALVTLPNYAVRDLRDACNAFLAEHYPETDDDGMATEKRWKP